MRDLLGTAIILGALQGFVVATFLWSRRANHRANQLLAALVAAVALMLALGEVSRRWGFEGHPHLLGLGTPLPFLFSPLLYLYIVTLTRPITRFDPRWFAHAVPFVADLLYMTHVFYSKSGAEKIALARLSDRGAVPISMNVITAVEIVQALVYLGLGWKELSRYGRKMHGYFSDLARIDLGWLRAMVVAHLAVWSSVLGSTVLRVFAKTPGALGDGVLLVSVLALFLTGYVSLWQPELVQKASAAKVAEAEPPVAPASAASPPLPEPAPARYRRNRLDDAEARALVTKLEALMRERELYREPGLTLPTLADALAVTPHTLSQVLNVHVGRSFFVYVNTFRAKALEAALAEPSNAARGILELAFEVGFSSKSTLNSSFKKHTGMTPSEFRARALASKKREVSRG